MIPLLIQKIHQAALQASQDFRSCESRLVEALMQVDEKEVFRHLGYPSLFRYAVNELHLTESIAYALIQVARTAKQVPELKREVADGGLSAFKAKKICAVLKRSEPVENQAWIGKAKNMSSRELEREVLKVTAPGTRALKLQISPELLKEFERCQELVSQSESKVATLETTLEALVKVYLKAKDPLEKANRQVGKSCQSEKREQVTGPVRRPIPANEKHLAVLRAQAQCAYVNPDGKRCPERRFLHFHHLRPVSRGGVHLAENLEILCSSHHRLLHWRDRRLSAERKSESFRSGVRLRPKMVLTGKRHVAAPSL